MGLEDGGKGVKVEESLIFNKECLISLSFVFGW